MRNALPVLFVLFTCTSFAQSGYWQQYLHFTITATLDDNEKSVTGAETITYTNSSPDTLGFIWFHLYANAYKDKTTALYQQLKRVKERQDKLKDFSPGSITGLNFTVDGATVKTEAHPKYVDIVKLLLPKPLAPGASIQIATPFKVMLPAYFSRSGYADGEFMICQWYPKPAVYDKEGWHEMPYLDMGEFYSEYASYQVNITVPSAYVVSATGILQTTDEANAYKAIGRYNTSHRDYQPKFYTARSTSPVKTLTYVADSVPDFAWFADKGFVIQYDTIRLASFNLVDAYTFYHAKDDTLWMNSIDYVKDAIMHYSKWVGEYSYPVVQAVDGPKNNSSGGMEYPMVTLITSPNAKAQTLDAVIAHEVGHNWYMAMLGTNERIHAWMDEGLNSYYQFRYEAEKYRMNSIFGDDIPAEVKQLTESQFQTAVYRALASINIAPPIETPSAQFATSQDYGLTVYLKPAEWMYLLENSVGKEKVDEAFQNYFRLWKFRHPQPADMQAAFEQTVNGKLTGFFDLLKKRGSLLSK